MNKKSVYNVCVIALGLLFAICPFSTVSANLLDELEGLEIVEEVRVPVTDIEVLGMLHGISNSEEVFNLVEELAYAKIFEPTQVQDILEKIQENIEEFHINQMNSSFWNYLYYHEDVISDYQDGKITFEKFFEKVKLDQYADPEKVLSKMWYTQVDLDYSRYEENTLFTAYHQLEDTSIEMQEQDELYFWYVFAENDAQGNDFDYDEWEQKSPKNFYFSWNTDGIEFKKVDPKDLKEWREFYIFDYIDTIEREKSYMIWYNYYIKRWDDYISLLYGYNDDMFSFESYEILSNFKRDYNYEKWITSSFYRSDDQQDFSIYRSTFEKVFAKYKKVKTTEQYGALLEKVKALALKKIDSVNYDNITDTVIDEKSYDIAYMEYKRLAIKEEILKALLYFIHTEVVKSWVAATIEGLQD